MITALALAVVLVGSQTPDAARVPRVALLDTCGDWTKNRRSNSDLAWKPELSWVVDFLARQGLNPPPDSTWAEAHGGVSGWLDKYCAAIPSAHLDDAAANLAFVLEPKS